MSDIIILKESLLYSAGYKYQVRGDFTVHIPALVEFGTIRYDFLRLENGNLTVLKGFAWDGASGLTFDTDSSMRGSCIHDAIYRLIRQKLLPESQKELADDILWFVCVKDGMWEWRANIWHLAVDKCGGSSVDPENKKKIKVAPCDGS